jgi:hypothetical protein
MNCNAVMKKLQRAILSTGLVIKISTSQFYSEEQDRFLRLPAAFLSPAGYKHESGTKRTGRNGKIRENRSMEHGYN